MSYNFEPMTDEEVESSGFTLLKDGLYEFQVAKSTRKVSKSGNPMCELQLMIWDEKGKTTQVFDYLVFSKVPLNRKKIKNFCASVGLLDQYHNCSLPEDLSRLCGKVNIGTRDEEPKPTGGYYPKRNHVVDYVVDENKQQVKIPIDVTSSSNNNIDDDIPF